MRWTLAEASWIFLACPHHLQRWGVLASLGDRVCKAPLRETPYTPLAHGAFQNEVIKSKPSWLNPFDKNPRSIHITENFLSFIHPPVPCSFALNFSFGKGVYERSGTLMAFLVTAVERCLFYPPHLPGHWGIKPQVDVKAPPCWELRDSLPSTDEMRCTSGCWSGEGFAGRQLVLGYGFRTWETTLFTFGSGNPCLNFLVHPR